MILRSNTISNSSTASSQYSNASVMPKSANTSNNGTGGQQSPISSSGTPPLPSPHPLTLKLQSNVSGMTSSSSPLSSASSQQQPALIYSPPSPQSPHTMATKCGFSPNVTTQSCSVIDDKDAQIKSLQGEIVSLKDVIKSRDAEIVKLRREIHKLKVSVMK